MTRNKPLAFYEFFAGGGMARRGLGETWQCLFANDFDPVKGATYRANFPDAADHFHEGDVWAVNPASLPGHADLAWASSPCQDFSLAGSRAGLAGGRSSAFFGFWQLVTALASENRAPNLIVIENVVGLLTSHAGADFEALCRALAQQNYTFGALEIDASRFVPQSRPRVFVIASKKAPSPSLTQVEPTAPLHSRRVVSAYEKLAPDLQTSWIWWRLRYPPPGNHGLAEILDNDHSAKWLSADRTESLLALLNPLHTAKLDRAKARNERTVGTIFRRMRVEHGKKVQRAELRFDGYAGCLRTPGGGSSRQFIVIANGPSVRIKQLSPTEGARLMGLDEDYGLPAATTSAFKVLGDGVVVPVVSFLRENLLEKLALENRQEVNESEDVREMAHT